MFAYEKGIKLREFDLWLDATRVVADACVSHGHADHIRRHRHSYATPATASFMRRRLGDIEITRVEFNRPFVVGPYQVTFLPAGHILGSAQIFVEFDGQSLLYSGDFKFGASATSETLQPQRSDILIMESTFGNPKYRFPVRAELEERLCNFVEAAFQNDQIPLVYGYALGKAQEAMKILANNGYRLCVHGSILRMAEVYQQHGVDFGDVVKFNMQHAQEGRVIILPPQGRKQRQVRRLQPARSMFLSGWGINPAARFRYGVDEVLPLSDHADFDGLLEYVRMVQPQRIYTTHGPNDYYLFLREQGFDAHPLVPKAQGDLFL